MDLRSKALFGLIGIFIIIVSILTVLSFTVILGNYQDLETAHVRGEMNLINNNIDGEVNNLQSNAPDWGAWDDTYAYARGEMPDYPKINLVNATFKTLRTNFIIITNREGTVIYGQGYDLVSDTPAPLRPDLVSELAQDRAFPLKSGEAGGVSGFLNLPEGPVILSEYPILHSDYSGPVQGSIVLGRFVDDPEIHLLTEGSNISLSILPFGSSSVSPSDRVLLGGAGETSVIVYPLDENTVEGQKVIRDIYGRDALLLTLQMNRDIYLQGKDTILFFIILQLGIVLISGLLILFYLDRMVLSRMRAISEDITGISRNWDTSVRIKITGGDEISRLADATNRMLDQIGEKHTALLESEKRYSAIVNNAPEPVLVIKNGTVVFINEAGVRDAGYPREEILGKNILGFLTKTSQETVHEARKTRSGKNNVSGYEAEFIKKDGRIMHLIVRAIDIFYHGEKVTLALLVDITERKVAEEALFRANRKLNLLSGITRHDIKNQLLILSGFLELSTRSLGDVARTSELIVREKRTADTLTHLINFTKDYEDMGVKSPVWQNISSVISNVVTLLPMRGIRVDAGDPTLEVFADSLLVKVFYNLIDNALRYGGETMTTIRVSHREENGNLVITVEDDGCGISPEDKSKLFTRGFGKNTGLGLFLSREILTITGMTITETGEAGKGARFEILVPNEGYRFTKEQESL